MQLRPLAAADRAPLEAVLRATGSFFDEEVEVALELIDYGIKGSQDYRFLVAADGPAPGDKVLGYACWGPTPMTDRTFDLYWIAVDPRRQGGGVGRALMAAVEQRLRSEGARLLLVETASKESYAATRAFYERIGYEEVARTPDFYRDGDDRVVYARRLQPRAVTA